ncbi:MAG TPA: hypothetical protein VLE89_08535 [Chlamydiales bacterium]|nr:hypothetical protein [Chlamydiales bacterium]
MAAPSGVDRTSNSPTPPVAPNLPRITAVPPLFVPPAAPFNLQGREISIDSPTRRSWGNFQAISSRLEDAAKRGDFQELEEVINARPPNDPYLNQETAQITSFLYCVKYNQAACLQQLQATYQYPPVLIKIAVQNITPQNPDAMQCLMHQEGIDKKFLDYYAARAVIGYLHSEFIQGAEDILEEFLVDDSSHFAKIIFTAACLGEWDFVDKHYPFFDDGSTFYPGNMALIARLHPSPEADKVLKKIKAVSPERIECTDSFIQAAKECQDIPLLKAILPHLNCNQKISHIIEFAGEHQHWDLLESALQRAKDTKALLQFNIDGFVLDLDRAGFRCLARYFHDTSLQQPFDPNIIRFTPEGFDLALSHLQQDRANPFPTKYSELSFSIIQRSASHGKLSYIVTICTLKRLAPEIFSTDAFSYQKPGVIHALSGSYPRTVQTLKQSPFDPETFHRARQIDEWMRMYKESRQE